VLERDHGITLPRWLCKVLLVVLAVAAVAGVYFLATTVRSWSTETWKSLASAAGIAVFAMAIAHYLCKLIPILPGLALSCPWKLLAPASVVFISPLP